MGEGLSLRRTAWRIAVVTVGAMLLAVATVAAVNAWNISQVSDKGIARLADPFPAPETRPPLLSGTAAGAQNLLLLGIDPARSAPGGAPPDSPVSAGFTADLAHQSLASIMVAHIPADRQSVSVLSIQPGSKLELPGNGTGTLDAAAASGGLPLVVQTVETLLGVRMDRVAVFDLAGFAAIADGLDGVEIAPSASVSTSSSRLTGTEAMALARQGPTGQQKLITAMLNDLWGKGKIASLHQLGELAAAVMPHVAVDEGLTTTYLVGLDIELRDVGTDVGFITLPLQPSAPQVEALRGAFRTDSLGDLAF
jgi:anionic cell wall polymer biosynthesis LytR-Cps2A-Psr (LCP) family protein